MKIKVKCGEGTACHSGYGHIEIILINGAMYLLSVAKN